MTPIDIEFRITKLTKEITEMNITLKDLLNRMNEFSTFKDEISAKINEVEKDIQILKDGGNI